MAYSITMADRVREILAASGKPIEEKPMFGGLCFMVDDKMCIGVRNDRIMVRLDPGLTDKVLEKDGCTPMVHGGKAMPGFVYVEGRVIATKRQLEPWIHLALEYNPVARATARQNKAGATREKASKKKNK